MLGLVSVDVFILLLWTFLDRPRGLSYLSSAGGLYKPVLFTACSTNLNSPFERAMVAWKAILLGAGVYKSICTWDMPSDIAEVISHAYECYRYTLLMSCILLKQKINLYTSMHMHVQLYVLLGI